MILAGQVVPTYNFYRSFMMILKKSQFLLALICFLAIVSCSSAFNNISNNTLDDRYSYISYNPKYNIKFHSLGGRKNVNRFLYKKYGTLVFTNKNYLEGNKMYTSLHIINKIPETLKKRKVRIIELYNTKVDCYEKTSRNRKVNERYFTYKEINYVFVTEFKKVHDKSAYDVDWYATQEMNGLEL